MVKIEGIEIEKGTKIVGTGYATPGAKGQNFLCLGWLYARADLFVFTFGKRRPSDALVDVDDAVLDKRVEVQLLRGGHYALQENFGSFQESEKKTFLCRYSLTGYPGRLNAGSFGFGWPEVPGAISEFEMDRSLCEPQGFADLFGVHGQELGPLSAGEDFESLGGFWPDVRGTGKDLREVCVCDPALGGDFFLCWHFVDLVKLDCV